MFNALELARDKKGYAENISLRLRDRAARPQEILKTNLADSVIPLKKVFQEQTGVFGGFEKLRAEDPYVQANSNIGANPEKYAKLIPFYTPSGVSIYTPVSPQFFADNGQKMYSSLVNERVIKENLVYANQNAEWMAAQHNSVGNRFQDYRRGYEFKYTTDYRPNTVIYSNNQFVSTTNPGVTKSLRDGVYLL